MKLNLLSTFKKATYDDWKKAAESLLKGAPFEKRMLTKTPEGIVLQPIYGATDSAVADVSRFSPGEGSYARGASASGYVGRAWDIAQEQPYGDSEVFNAALIRDLMGGQSAVNVILDAATQLGLDPDQATDPQVGECGLSLSKLEDLKTAFRGVEAEYLPVYFQSGCSGLAVQALFLAWQIGESVDRKAVKGGLGMDPLEVLASRGELPVPLEKLWDELALLVEENAKNAPDFRSAGISAMSYHIAGASATDELASALASGLSYLRAMGERGISIDSAARQVRFTLSIGANFFTEIAKFRAARSLWSRIVKELGGKGEACRMQLHARTGLVNKTQLDPYVNLLRTTTEAFSAVVGGASSITVGCFDETIRVPDDFSRRIARNVQVILQEECELTAVIDPAGGSWYIDTLTDQISLKAWESFQGIEKDGGIVASLESGNLQKRLAETRLEKEQKLAQRRSSLIGTNQYPNLEEKPLGEGVPTLRAFKDRVRTESEKCRGSVDIEALIDLYGSVDKDQKLAFLVASLGEGGTIGAVSEVIRGEGKPEKRFEPLPSWRLSQKYEALRRTAISYKTKTGNAPTLFLANLGPLKRHKIRADFTRSFFAAGGFESLYSEGIENVDEGVKAFLASRARIAVICGTDPDYLEKVPSLAKELKAAKPDMKLLLAGYPGEHWEAFQEAGLDDYIFIKSDNYAVNRTYLEWLGIL